MWVLGPVGTCLAVPRFDAGPRVLERIEAFLVHPTAPNQASLQPCELRSILLVGHKDMDPTSGLQ